MCIKFVVGITFTVTTTGGAEFSSNNIGVRVCVCACVYLSLFNCYAMLNAQNNFKMQHIVNVQCFNAFFYVRHSFVFYETKTLTHTRTH